VGRWVGRIRTFPMKHAIKELKESGMITSSGNFLYLLFKGTYHVDNIK
jgi:hypothetical protein